MKKKKSFILLLFLSTFLLLTGCGNSNKQTLINEYDKTASRKKVKSSFDIKMPKFELSQEDKDGMDAQTRLFLTLIKQGSIKGDLYSDGKNVKLDSKLKIMEQNVPFEFVGNGDKLYLGADAIESFVTLTSGIPATSKNSKFDGKYIDLIEVMKESGSLDNKDVKEFKSMSEMMENIQKDNAKAFKDTIKSIPDSAVTKKDDEITATLHKKDIKKLFESLKNEYGQDKSIKSNPITKKDIDEFDSNYNKFDLVIKLNTKKSTFNYDVSCKSKKGEEVEVQAYTKSEDYNGKVEMPSKDKVLDTKELVKLYKFLSGSK